MKKVLVGGVFDLLHPGHVWFLQKSRGYGDYLVVVVARDRTVEKKKGRLPVIPEDQRLEMVKSLRFVDEAVLGNENDFLETVKKINPDLVVLGHDQSLDEKITKYLKEKQIEIIKLKEKKDGNLMNTSLIIKRVKEGL